MTQRLCVANYNYLYGGGPQTFGGTNSVSKNSASMGDNLTLDFADGGTGGWAGYFWNAAVNGQMMSSYSLEGSWGAVTGIEASGSTTLTASAGGNIGSAQVISSTPGNEQIFEFTVTTPQDYHFAGNVVHNVPLQQNPANLALQRWNGFVWATLYTSNSSPGQQGFFVTYGTLEAGSYRVLNLIQGAGTAYPGGAPINYQLNYQMLFDVAPVGRFVVGNAVLQQWLGAVNGERVSYDLRPIAGGAGVSGPATLSSDGQFSIRVWPDMKPGPYLLWVKGRKWQAKLTTVTIPASGTADAGTLLLRAGDSDGNNVVDSDDYDLFIDAYGEPPGSPGYDERADLDGVNGVDSDDFDILVQHFGEQGDQLP